MSSGGHVLLVEDESDLAEPIARLLGREGFRVTTAQTVTEARQRLGSDVALVILDVMLPEGEDAGFAFARELMALSFPGKILCLTARDSVADRLEALGIGVHDYLLKPFSLRELLQRVRALLAS